MAKTIVLSCQLAPSCIAGSSVSVIGLPPPTAIFFSFRPLRSKKASHSPSGERIGSIESAVVPWIGSPFTRSMRCR